MLNFDLQNHRPLREIVYEELKRQIMIGEIPPGTRMMEVELADDMGVSRTPIREAIRKLEKEGLVSIEPRRGAYASDVSIKDMVDVLEVREFLEGMAAGLAAKKITEEEVDEAYAKAIDSVEALELKNMLRREEDEMSCVLKINSGAGGTESQDWASMLMRMYMRYAEAHGYKTTISNLQNGDEAGIKTVTMQIEGDYAYGYLKSENASNVNYAKKTIRIGILMRFDKPINQAHLPVVMRCPQVCFLIGLSFEPINISRLRGNQNGNRKYHS